MRGGGCGVCAGTRRALASYEGHLVDGGPQAQVHIPLGAPKNSALWLCSFFHFLSQVHFLSIHLHRCTSLDASHSVEYRFDHPSSFKADAGAGASPCQQAFSEVGLEPQTNPAEDNSQARLKRKAQRTACIPTCLPAGFDCPHLLTRNASHSRHDQPHERPSRRAPSCCQTMSGLSSAGRLQLP